MMTDRMLFSLSIFLTGLGAGVALAAWFSPHSAPQNRDGKGVDPATAPRP